MIDVAAIKARFEMLASVLDERERRLFAACEAWAAGHGGVVAVSRATGMARNTIDRGLAELKAGPTQLGERVRRAGRGFKPATETQPGILPALNELAQSSIRGDPEAALLWVSKSQRHLSAALAKQGFIAGQKLVGRLLRRLSFSLQANAKTREGGSHPDRNAQFEHINAVVSAFQSADDLGRHKKEGTRPRLQEWRMRVAPQGAARAGPPPAPPAPLGRGGLPTNDQADFGRSAGGFSGSNMVRLVSMTHAIPSRRSATVLRARP